MAKKYGRHCMLGKPKKPSLRRCTLGAPSWGRNLRWKDGVTFGTKSVWLQSKCAPLYLVSETRTEATRIWYSEYSEGPMSSMREQRLFEPRLKWTELKRTTMKKEVETGGRYFVDISKGTEYAGVGVSWQRWNHRLRINNVWRTTSYVAIQVYEVRPKLWRRKDSKWVIRTL